MKANNYISKNEYRLLLIIAFISFVLAVSSFISFSIESYNEEVELHQTYSEIKANSGATFAVDAGQDFRPLYRRWFIFLTLFIFLAVLNAKKFLVSFSFTLIPFLIFTYWIVRTNEDIKLNETYMSGTPHLLKIATHYDYFVFLFISILLFWQISILLRMLIKTLQRKTELP